MNQVHTIQIDNSKSGGCATTIQHGLAKIDNVSEVIVDQNKATVCFKAPNDQLSAVKQNLQAMGYPETGSVAGFAAGVATAKSYVSCAIGKLG